MTDNDLIALLIAQANAGMVSGGFTGVTVQQKHQPTQQGVPIGRSVFVQKLFDQKYGFPGRTLKFNEADDNFDQNEIQCIETNFQFSVMARQTSDDTLPTASDIANYLSQYLACDFVLDQLLAVNANVLRVTEIRNMPFADDEFRDEFQPSFDMVVTHARSLDFKVAKVDRITGDAFEV